MVEREFLARMIAELPVTLAWRILQSPLGEEQLDLTALQQADLHYLLIGSDIRAPVGLEWRVAYQSGRYTIPLLKTGVSRTPAGQNFVRELAVNWYSFRDNTTLRRWTQQVLVELLLEQSIEFQLTPAEIVQLQTLRAAEKADEPTSAHQEAGHSAVILSPERYIPSEGRLIGDPPANS